MDSRDCPCNAPALSGTAGEVLGGLPLVHGQVLRGGNIQEPGDAARCGLHQLRGQRSGQRLHLQHPLHNLRLALTRRHNADLLRTAPSETTRTEYS